MNMVYVVTPIALLAAFTGYFVPASARLDATLAARTVADERQREATRDADDQRRQRAADEIARQAEARRLALAEKERQLREAEERQDQKLFSDLCDARAARETLRAEIQTLENRRQAFMDENHDASATLHTARRASELLRIARRNVDLELQRATLLLAEGVDIGLLADAPIFPRPDVH